MCLRSSKEDNPDGLDSESWESRQSSPVGDDVQNANGNIGNDSVPSACSTETSSDNSSCGTTRLSPNIDQTDGQTSRWRRRFRFVIAVIIAIPILMIFSLFYRGSLLLLEYRKFFGNRAPITLSPMHGVVSAFVSSTQHQHEPSCASETLFDDLDYQFKTYRSGLRSETIDKPLRILIMGDSTARGVGVQESCHPVMPEVLATVLSRHFNGRPVYWSAVGEPGATIKMVAQQIETTKRAPDGPSMQQFHELHKTPIAAATISTEGNGNANNTCQEVNETETGYYTPDQQQWIEQLEYHEKLYLANPYSGFDYIVALSGVNEVKRIIIPFLVQESDGFDSLDSLPNGTTCTTVDDDDDNNSTFKKERGFKGDLTLLIHKLKEVANDHNEDCSGEDCVVPHIVFPGMPVKHAPARMGSVLRWIGIHSCKILDDLKKVAEAQDPDHVFAAPIVSDKDTLDFIHHKGILADAINAEEDVKLRLVHVNGRVCRDLVDEMTSFYAGNQASVEPDMNMLELFSPDAVHPNDFGYDYFGRYLGLMIIDKWLANKS